jgi:DNA-binding NarL/FixJ family response regulator
MLRIGLIAEDLFLSVKILEAAERAGHTVQRIDRQEDWLAARPAEWDVVLIEAASTRLPWPDWVAALKALPRPPRLIAFGNHTRLDLRDRAYAAGVDVYVANSQVASALADVLARYGGGATAAEQAPHFG